jgi:alkylresorcinol/alkylpyrone synthase
MVRLRAISCVVPSHEVDIEQTKALLLARSPESTRLRLTRALERSRNRTRHAVLPLPELMRLGGAAQRSALFGTHARLIAERALAQLADLGELHAEAISTVIFVSATGYAAPSIETDLIRRFAINPRCRRIPLTQLGCGGGVAALSLAAEIARRELAEVLVVSTELPSLQLQLAEPSYPELLAATQFGDGAAAAVVSSTGEGPAIIGTESVLLPEVEEGGRVIQCETGLRLGASAGLPSLIRSRVGGLLSQFAEAHGVDARDLAFLAAHPRGPEVLAAVADGLSLPAETLAGSWSTWERNGNMLSASIFSALSDVARSRVPLDGDVGALVAFGTGVSCEMALLRWHGAPQLACS